ncbi:MAG: TetR/AcrR family transcriptional regulator [Pusillimonas sp.]
MTAPTALPRRRGRPPNISKLHLETRQSLIRYGTQVLTEQGFDSTSIDQILKHLDIPKGSFYHYFPSKESFGLAVIDSYAEYFARKLDRWLLDRSLTPLARLAGFIDDARYGMIRHEFRRGCLIGNLSQEFGATHETFAARLEQTFKDWQHRLARCLDEAKASKELGATGHTEQLAAFFWIGWEGAVMRARLMRSDTPMLLFSRMFFSSLPK